MKIYIPSFQRPRSVFALEIFPSAVLVVCASEEAAYRKHNPDATLHVIADELEGNLSVKRNAILKLAETEPDKTLVMVDDDLCCFFDKEQDCALTGEEALAALQQLADAAAKDRANYFGVSPHPRCRWNPAEPFNRVDFINFLYGFRVPLGLAYDPALSGVEDTDLFLQCLEEGRGVFRWERFGVDVVRGNRGGLDRVVDRKTSAAQALALKWGGRVVELTADGSLCGLNPAAVKPLKKAS